MKEKVQRVKSKLKRKEGRWKQCEPVPVQPFEPGESPQSIGKNETGVRRSEFNTCYC